MRTAGEQSCSYAPKSVHSLNMLGAMKVAVPNRVSIPQRYNATPPRPGLVFAPQVSRQSVGAISLGKHSK